MDPRYQKTWNFECRAKMTAQQVAEHFSQVATVYEQAMLSRNYTQFVHVADAVADHFSMKPESVLILDVAAGTGLLGKELLARGFKNIDWLDPSEGMELEAKKTGIYRDFYLNFMDGHRTPGIVTDNSLTVVPESPSSSQCSSDMDSSSVLQERILYADNSVVEETPSSSQESSIHSNTSISEARGSLFLGSLEDDQKENILPVLDRKGMTRCHICYKWLKDSSIKVHLRRHNKDFSIACTECSETFISNDMLKEHIAREHRNRELCACTVCGKKLTTYRGMREHVKIHSGEIHNCNVCHWESSSKSQLARHMKTHDKKEVCQVCDKAFSTRTQLKKHNITHMESPQLFGCSSCSYKSPWQASVKRHVEVQHTEGRHHICDTCGKSFKDKSNLARHLKNVKCDKVQQNTLWKDLL